MKSGIYQIVGPNCKRYVGQSINISKRRTEHFLALRKGEHKCRHLQTAYNKHGYSAFIFSVLEYCEPDHLTEREQFHMTGKLYNSAPAAGTTRGIKRTPEMVEAMRARLIGIPCSEEQKEAIRNTLKGRVQPQSEIDARRETIARPVVLKDGQTWPTVTEFAKACGYKYRAAITNALARGQTFDMIAERRKDWLNA